MGTDLYNLLLGGINGYSFPNNFVSLLSDFSDSIFEGINIFEGVTTNVLYAQEIVELSIDLISSITPLTQNVESSASMRLCREIGSVTYQLISLLNSVTDGEDHVSLFLNEIEEYDDESRNYESSMESGKENDHSKEHSKEDKPSKENSKEHSKENKPSKENSKEHSKVDKPSKENSKEHDHSKEHGPSKEHDHSKEHDNSKEHTHGA